MEKNLLTERRGQVIIITLNRPGRMNALDKESIKVGTKLIRELYYDKDIRVIIITGTGDRAFCAGADLKEREKMNMGEVREYIKMIKETFSDIENLSKPVI